MASENVQTSSLDLSLSVFPCPRFADYFCINHHNTGKASQFSACVGKVCGFALKRKKKSVAQGMKKPTRRKKGGD